MRFRIGDRVIPYDYKAKAVVGHKNIGTVIEVKDNGSFIKIKWDKPKLDKEWDRNYGLYVCSFYSSRVKHEVAIKDGKYENVCSKIREMNYKRKELGYAF